MAEAADRQQWGHTSHLLATIINANPFIGGNAIHPDSLNPYTVAEQAENEKNSRVMIKGSEIALRYGRSR